MSMFQNAGQAVHFSYMLDAYPVGPQSTLATAVKLTKQQFSRSGIDFGGLGPADIRIECDRIRAIVRQSLPAIEAAALEARYSQIPAEQEAAMEKVERFVTPFLRDVMTNGSIIHTLVRRHYVTGPGRGHEWSFRAIADSYKTGKTRIFKTAKEMEAHITRIEASAIERLRKLFDERGLIIKAMEEAA